MIEKMQFVSITGPKADIDRVVDQYLSRYEIHLENALAQLQTLKTLTPYLQINPYKGLLAKALEYEKLLDSGNIQTNLTMTLDEAVALIESIDQQLTRINEQKNELEDQMNRAESINRELKKAQEEYRSAVDQCDEIRSVYAHLERLFLDAQAGILAQNLQAGMPSPVCGSIHHPAPAKLSEEIPDQKELKRKEQEKAQAEEKVQRLSERASFFKRNLDQEMRNTAELICGTEKNLVKEALIVTGPDELVTAADPVIEKLDDELRALEIRIKANTEQQKVLDGLGGMINRLETDLNAAGERNKELALSEQNLVTVLTMLRKHVEELQR